ncbi:FUN14 domain-containing protein [Thermococcus sp.]|uniref:FUN14 domain-containing protein n=1 Tax=Thermococcus sp. TaxID=35749 RepID=UPI002604C18B|nr:FUN14 domain-containing protein [Thermococcus sp.]
MDLNLNGIIGDVGVWGIVGLITGYALKKLLKLTMALIGAYILSLFYLQQKGVITINTDKLFNLASNITQQVIGLGQKVVGILPGTGSFVAGFYIGFKKG